MRDNDPKPGAKVSATDAGRGDKSFRQQLQGYSLTTAEILYHLPDHPRLLQTFLWQDYDIDPRFPKLTAFLDFWSRNLDGKLHSIKVANRRLISPREVRFLDGSFQVN